MNRQELNLMNMFNTVDQFLTMNSAEFAGYAPITSFHAKLKGDIVDIDSLSQTQAMETKGQTKLKVKEKEDLDATILKVAAAMTAIAATNNDILLRSVSTVEKTTLKRLREADYQIKVQTIYKAALPIAQSLATWGVTEDDIELLNSQSNSLKLRTPDIRNVKVITKQASTELKQKITNTKTDLKETLDALMKPFQTLNPTVYGQYKNARTTLDKAAGQTKKLEELTQPA